VTDAEREKRFKAERARRLKRLAGIQAETFNEIDALLLAAALGIGARYHGGRRALS